MTRTNCGLGYQGEFCPLRCRIHSFECCQRCQGKKSWLVWRLTRFVNTRDAPELPAREEYRVPHHLQRGQRLSLAKVLTDFEINSLRTGL